MGILSSTINFISGQLNNAVFGTFSAHYPPSEFEREREDGVTIFDLNPDVRVFVGGADVTKDVDGVTVNNTLLGNTCNITLNNPKGRYVISKMDLMKKWREDKDILAAYDYKEFERQDPLSYDKIAQKLGDSILGAGGGAKVSQSMDMLKQTGGLLNSIFGAVPKVRGTTRMVFETKFASGIVRRVGDCVFDYRDPVVVFMKGRFSPYWYFAFTGFVITYSDNDQYGSQSVITLQCQDTMAIWKRTKWSMRSAFYSSANLENMMLNNASSNKFCMYEDQTTGLTFSNMIRSMVYNPDFRAGVFNHTPIQAGRPGDFPYNDLTLNPDEYEFALNDLKEGMSIGETLKTTDPGLLANIANRVMKTNSGVIKCSDIDYLGFRGGPNQKPLGPANSLYFQHNEIILTQFNGENISKAYDLSARLWEADHEIDSYYQLDPNKGTGWKDNKAFGVCGIHPAMDYTFISNFGILEDVWKQIYSNSKSVDNLVISPYEKIRETVAGSPTEKNVGSQSISSKPSGTNLNFFRPRLFVLVPQRYANVRGQNGNFTTAIGKIFDEESTSVYEFIRAKLKNLEYEIYCSPMGDVFIEPTLYDMHPLEFCGKIEARSIVKKELTTNYQTGITDTNGVTVPTNPEIPAYFFNPKANHPYFLMEKDRISNIQEFTPDNIVTTVQVQGSSELLGGTVGSMMAKATGLMNAVTNLNIGGGSAGKTSRSKNVFVMGRYVANGLQEYLSNNKISEQVQQNSDAVKKIKEQYDKLVFFKLISEHGDDPISDIISGFLKSLDDTFLVDWNKDNNKISELKSFVASHDSETDRYIYVLKHFGNNILNSDPSFTTDELKANASLYSQVLEKTVTQIFKDDKKSESFSTTIGSDIDKVKAIWGSVSEVSSDGLTDDMKQRLLNAENSLAIEGGGADISNFNDTNNSNILGITRNLVFELMYLYEPSAILDDANIKALYTDMMKKKSEIQLPSQLRAVTYGDLKKFQKAGVYNPRTDLTRLYGYKHMDALNNPYISADKEATDYAKAVFNRLLGKTKSMNVTLVGRPELQLNRPYYLELKDCLGLSSTFGINFKYGSDFSSTVKLDYIRNNALTYDYTLDNMDVITGYNDNAYFSMQGSLYLKTFQLLQRASKAAGEATTNATKGNDKKSNILGQVAGDVVTDLADMIQLGGLYSVHTDLGHMNYNDRGKEPVRPVAANIQKASKILISVNIQDTLISIAKDITTNLDKLVKYNMENVYNIYNDKITAAKQKTADAEELLKTTINAQVTGYDVKKRTENIKKYSAAVIEAKRNEKTVVDEANKAQSDNLEVKKLLFGSDISITKLNYREQNLNQDIHTIYPSANYKTSGLYYQLFVSTINALNASKNPIDAKDLEISKEPVDDVEFFTSANEFYITRIND